MGSNGFQLAIFQWRMPRQLFCMVQPNQCWSSCSGVCRRDMLVTLGRPPAPWPWYSTTTSYLPICFVITQPLPRHSSSNPRSDNHLKSRRMLHWSLIYIGCTLDGMQGFPHLYNNFFIRKIAVWLINFFSTLGQDFYSSQLTHTMSILHNSAQCELLDR